MRDYGKVHSSFWSSDTTRGMSEDGRQLALYLLTSPHGTISGVFRMPDGYVCEDLQWTAERVNSTLVELLNKGFANRCGTTKWVWIFNHFEWNKPENPNQRKSAKKIALSIPDSCSWKPLFMQYWADFLDISPEEIKTLTKPLDNPCLTNSSNSNSNSNSNTLSYAHEENFEAEQQEVIESFIEQDENQDGDFCTGQNLDFDDQHLKLARMTGLGTAYPDELVRDIFNLFRCYKTNVNTLKQKSEWLNDWRTWCQREKVKHARPNNGNQSNSQTAKPENNTQRAMRLAREAAERIASQGGSSG